MIPVQYFFVLSALLFFIGVYGFCRPGRKQLFTDRSPLPRRQTIPMNPAPGPAVRRRPSAARRALPGTCGRYWTICIWTGWTPEICCCWVCCTFCFGKRRTRNCWWP